MKKHAAQRINGEWFQFTQGQVDFLVREMAVAQIDAASNFSNLDVDAAPNKRQVKLVYQRIPREGHRNDGAGWQRRLDKLTKENYALKDTIEKLLDKQKLTVI